MSTSRHLQEWSLTASEGQTVALTVTAREAPALWVATPQALPGVRFSDLFFHLQRGESRTVTLQLDDALILDELESALELVSFLD